VYPCLDQQDSIVKIEGALSKIYNRAFIYDSVSGWYLYNCTWRIFEVNFTRNVILSVAAFWIYIRFISYRWDMPAMFNKQKDHYHSPVICTRYVYVCRKGVLKCGPLTMEIQDVTKCGPFDLWITRSDLF